MKIKGKNKAFLKLIFLFSSFFGMNKKRINQTHDCNKKFIDVFVPIETKNVSFTKSRPVIFPKQLTSA